MRDATLQESFENINQRLDSRKREFCELLSEAPDQKFRSDVTCSDSLPFSLQVYEMYVTGYQFKVLSPVFTVHWGLQTRKSRPAWRERQNSANRKQFETFKKEVFARYMRDPLKMMKNAN
jgi:N-acetyllactosaminide beta-1,3-N-acetylglucosaminyltransferase